MHFSASSQWSKICFGYPGIIFNGKKGLKFSQIVLVRLEGGDPPSPPKRSAWPLFHSFFFEPFPKCSRNSQLFVSSSQPASQPASLILWDFFAFKNKNKWLNTLPDFKCSNKTVRRQYILNQVLKARINIVVITVTTFHHELKVFELEEACPYKIGCIFLENCQKGGGGCHFQIK